MTRIESASSASRQFIRAIRAIGGSDKALIGRQECFGTIGFATEQSPLLSKQSALHTCKSELHGNNPHFTSSGGKCGRAIAAGSLQAAIVALNFEMFGQNPDCRGCTGN